MENNGSPRRKVRFFNLFDIILIIIALALCAALYLARGRSSGASLTTAATAGKVTYTVELTGMMNGAEQDIKAGDKLVDKVKKYNVGTVQSVSTMETTVQTVDAVNGGIKNSPIADQKTAVVKITANCTETPSQITVDGGFIIRVGLPVNMKGPGYFGSGFIVSVERSGN